MALKTIFIVWVLTSILVSLVFTACASRPMGPWGENTSSHSGNSQVNDFQRMIPRFKSKSAHIPLTSARQVPTGPDPLHHHSYSPFKPFP